MKTPKASSLGAAFQNLSKELTELNSESRRLQTFVAVNVAVGAFMGVTRLVNIPVLIQMLTYSLPILWYGSHLSLDMRVRQNENDDPDAKKSNGEILTRKDAAMFPLLASVTIFGLYLAFQVLPEQWVNTVLSVHITAAGWWSVGETIKSSLILAFPSLDAAGPTLTLRPFWPFRSTSFPLHLSKVNVLSAVLGGVVAVGWLVTRAWVLHNLFAIGFAIQAIHLMSVGNFKTASVLLVGLFLYDIFWVFGTDVMVKVAKTFNAPAKILFPRGQSGEYSLLGLGDIIVPGVFVAMTLRFDYWLHERWAEEKDTVIDKSVRPLYRVFSKFYFTTSMVAYALSLLATGVIMLVFKAAQPALLYLVPAILLALYLPAMFRGQFRKVLEFNEEEEADEAGSESGSSDSESEAESEK